MKQHRVFLASLGVAATLALPSPGLAQTRYTATQTGDIVQLRDTRADVVVSVLTPVSNAYEMVVKGQDVIRIPFATVDDFRARPGLNGIPLLAPFANRLDEQAFYANGRKYNFDMELGNVRGAIPIHGYLSGANAWKVVEAKADGRSAWVTTTLDFYRNPQYMAQFPFAHTLRMTYRLQDGALEVRTRIDNLSIDPMPVAIGFHPYFQLTDSVREDWTLSVAARTRWVLAQNNVPTGETEPAATFFGGTTKDVPLKNFAARLIDDVFGDLERDAQGRATFTLKGKQQQLDVLLGPNYKSMVIYSTVPGGNRGAGAAQGNAPAVGRGAAAATPAPTAAGVPPAPSVGGGRGGVAPAPPVSKGPNLPLTGRGASPAPANRGFVALEPMAGITNSMNAAHKGLYKELQSIAPGGSWEESFWIRATGF